MERNRLEFRMCFVAHFMHRNWVNDEQFDAHTNQIVNSKRDEKLINHFASIANASAAKKNMNNVRIEFQLNHFEWFKYSKRIPDANQQFYLFFFCCCSFIRFHFSLRYRTVFMFLRLRENISIPISIHHPLTNWLKIDVSIHRFQIYHHRFDLFNFLFALHLLRRTSASFFKLEFERETKKKRWISNRIQFHVSINENPSSSLIRLLTVNDN